MLLARQSPGCGKHPAARPSAQSGKSRSKLISRSGIIDKGGNSDTLACITGGIAEAFYGMPQELRDETLKRLPEDIREAYELLCFMIAKMI